MIRVLALLIGLTVPALAQNTQCPGSNQSWSNQLPAPMAFMVYDLTGLPGVPLGFLTVVQQGGKNARMDTYIGVPQTIAQQFPISANPLQFYQTRIAPVYHELLLLSGSDCPLQLQASGGALWTH